MTRELGDLIDDDDVVVVECYCFLINIIVEPPDLLPPPFLTTVLHFQHYLLQNCNIPMVKRLAGKSGPFVVVAVFAECFTLSACRLFENFLKNLPKSRFR